MKPAIRIDTISKQYRLGTGQVATYRDLRDVITDVAAAPFRRVFGRNGQAPPRSGGTLWALKNVSFDVQPGEVVGIIGRNGAGKSTLLKILSRITEPTSGRVELRGRIASLLEVGTGFHPDLTGRENIYLNGAILGMSRREIRHKFDDIVAFSEIEQFLDTPVKRYSSGMYVRLAFAVAAHLESEVLVVDEVLAVGDVEFQKKCLGKMQDIGGAGRTVLFISHNLAALQALCRRGVLLRTGELVADAPIDRAIATYLQMLGQTALKQVAERTDRKGLGRTRLQQIEISSGEDGVPGAVTLGRPARIVFHLDRFLPGLSCVFTVVDQYGHSLAKFNSYLASREDAAPPGPESPRIVCAFDEWLLAPGRYRLDVRILANGEVQDQVDAAAFFDVERGPVRGREAPRTENDWKMTMPHRWLVPDR